jgi:hypothetical protein
MRIAGVGELTWDDKLGGYVTEPLPVGALRGQVCRLVLEGYDEDPNQDEFNAVVAAFASSERDLLSEAEPYVYEYYTDASADDEGDEGDEGDEDGDELDRKEIWTLVGLGSHLIVSRRHRRDRGVYILLECSCDWEQEHGLQLVFKDGRSVNKVGPFDGHLTNSDAFDDDDLEDVVYVGR